VDLRIGVTHVARELTVEMADDTDADALRDDIEAALAGEGVLWLTDRTGRRTGIPVEKLAYIEIGSPESRRIGFASR
jgi:hypothetical protein